MVLRIFIMIATSGFLTALECTKFVFRPLGEFTALPKPPSWYKGPTSKGRERGWRRRKGKGEEGHRRN